MVDGFGQKLDSARLHCPYRHRDIGVAANEDNGQMHVRLDEIIVKIKPTTPGKPDIENETARLLLAGAIQKFLHRGKRFSLQAHRMDKILKCLSYLEVVIND